MIVMDLDMRLQESLDKVHFSFSCPDQLNNTLSLSDFYHRLIIDQNQIFFFIKVTFLTSEVNDEEIWPDKQIDKYNDKDRAKI